MRTSSVAVFALLSATALTALFAAPAHAQTDAATLTVQFDNSRRAVLDGSKRQPVINALAESVFKVNPNQVTIVGGLNQGGALNSQSVVIFRAVGPTSNRRRVLQNCQENVKGGWLGLTDSPAKKAVKKATDTWWPGDKVEIQKASCAQG